MLRLGKVIGPLERQSISIKYHYPSVRKIQQKCLELKPYEFRLKTSWLCLEDKNSEDNYLYVIS